MKLAVVALVLGTACSHGDAVLREEQAKTRHYRDAYETQAQEIQKLKKRVAELESRDCR